MGCCVFILNQGFCKEPSTHSLAIVVEGAGWSVNYYCKNHLRKVEDSKMIGDTAYEVAKLNFLEKMKVGDKNV